MTGLSTTRRQVLAGLGSLGAIGTGLLGASRAGAFTGGGYKALVCVFLKGGMDGHDTLIPYDRGSYDAWAGRRASLLDEYALNAGGSTRARDRLLEIAPTALPGQDLGSRAFALPPEFERMAGLFGAGKASVVGNVGPLIRPTTRAQVEAGTAVIPPKLFSHNDQQATWTSLEPSGAGFGWGAGFAAAADAANANADDTFTMVSVAGSDDFVSGRAGRAFEVDPGGTQLIWEMERANALGNARSSATARAALDGYFEMVNRAPQGLFAQDVVAIQRRAIAANEDFGAALEAAAAPATAFPNTGLGKQLKMVAHAIAARQRLGATRQVFYVDAGGFDTHSGQAGALPALQAQIDAAIGAFYDATVAMQLQDAVTTFTASDFGRTLVANGDGTDHGWGGHQFVVGGAVNGGRLFGAVPGYEADHAQDSGRGRLIPTTSVEQMAAPLGRWFGLSETETTAAFPNLRQQGAALDLI